MTADPPQLPGARRAWRRRLAIAALVCGCLLLVSALGRAFRRPVPPEVRPPATDAVTFPLATERRLTVWWDGPSGGTRAGTRVSGPDSNIRPSDYAGPQACQKCHPRNYESWSGHPHRWMNALADESTVKGDFTGEAAINYKGGRGTFYRESGQYFMRLERGGVRRTYHVTQTIGSRFYQYYVGKLVEGPEPPGHPFYGTDHVLHFGYWLAEKEWVPIVHVGPEEPDERRPDPFAPQQGGHYAAYAPSCNYCHTTFPLGDMFGRNPGLVSDHAPRTMHFLMRPYIEESHPDLLSVMAEAPRRQGGAPSPRDSDDPGRGEVVRGGNPMVGWAASEHAVTLGVSCEACHLGAKEHVASGGEVPPKFFPSSPNLLVEGGGEPPDFGRTHDNVNWACGRCHTGRRPKFAAGMSTWNSVEYSDAMRGGCYSKLRCIDCHDPHKALGPAWTRTADQDDALCLKCHDKFRPAEARVAHTHHPMGSAGRCLDCHMPRINEGLQAVVRTHMIYSPTRADMIEANHPNACNQCHTDRPIAWTLGRLKEWYGKTYDEGKIAAHYPERAGPAAQGWLRSDNMAVRLVAADALTRARDATALPRLLEALDDPYLLNRQFAAEGLQRMLGPRLTDSGYHFYMTSEERRRPLADLRTRLLPPTGAKGR